VAVLNDSVHFVENAQAMYHAAVLGKLNPLSNADIASFEKYFQRGRHVNKLWRFYVESAQSEGGVPADWDI
jgi:L-ribulose-5-phosphate 4-epimerase